MSLRTKITDPATPVVFYEVIPPRADIEGDLEDRLRLVREVASQIDAINIPEIREEKRNGLRERPLPERIEPRAFAQAIAAATQVESVVNRVTVHESVSEQRRWLCETYHQQQIRNLILVGGESGQHQYPGPSVIQMSALAAEEGLPFLLGGICIAHRHGEGSRVRKKAQHGLQFFTTQVLLDSQDIVHLLRQLDGLKARVVLSFTPVSHPRDLSFLEWLGVNIPAAFASQIRRAGSHEEAVEQSLSLARGILTKVFAELPSDAPALGIQVERITKRNSASARRMLAELGEFYRRLQRDRRGDPMRGGGSASTISTAPQPSRGKQ